MINNEWRTKTNNRTSNDTDCPYCAGNRVIHGKTDLFRNTQKLLFSGILIKMGSEYRSIHLLIAITSSGGYVEKVMNGLLLLQAGVMETDALFVVDVSLASKSQSDHECQNNRLESADITMAILTRLCYI